MNIWAALLVKVIVLEVFRKLETTGLIFRLSFKTLTISKEPIRDSRCFLILFFVCQKALDLVSDNPDLTPVPSFTGCVTFGESFNLYRNIFFMDKIERLIRVVCW